MTALFSALSAARPDGNENRLALLRALDRAALCRDEALRRFDRVADDALIVSAVHELEAAAAQYSALLRQAKEMGIRRTFYEAEAMKRTSYEEFL